MIDMEKSAALTEKILSLLRVLRSYSKNNLDIEEILTIYNVIEATIYYADKLILEFIENMNNNESL